MYTFAVIDGCDGNGKLFTVEAPSEDDALEIFVKKSFPLLPDSFEYDSFVRMLESEDINVIFLGEAADPIRL